MYFRKYRRRGEIFITLTLIPLVIFLLKDFLTKIYNLSLVDFKDRYENWDLEVPCCSLDGTDWLIQENRPLDKDYYSHKLKHSVLRNKVVFKDSLVEWLAAMRIVAWLSLGQKRFHKHAIHSKNSSCR
jgi:hypothetical protein